MTVQELIDRLANLDPSAEVLIATNPAWPIARTIVAVTETRTDPEMDDYSREAEPGEDAQAIVWLASGDMPWSASPYAPREAWGSDD
jgi:hypothetical protein